MCELLGLAFKGPVSANFSLHDFRQHGKTIEQIRQDLNGHGDRSVLFSNGTSLFAYRDSEGRGDLRLP